MAYQYLFNLKMDVSSLVRVDLVRLLPEPWHKIVNLQILESLSKSLPEQFLPDQENIFRALSIPPAHVKVVIVGQDPYPNPKYAMGMAFSVRENTNPLPASLKNIFTELEDDLGYKRTNGDLSDWKDQGVLLLNRSLTVELLLVSTFQKRMYSPLHIRVHYRHIVVFLDLSPLVNQT